MYGYSGRSTYVDINTSWLVAVIAILTTIGLVFLAYKFIIPEKRRARLPKLGQLLHDFFNFNFLIIEKVMKFFYVVATLFVVSFGLAGVFGFYIYISDYYETVRWFGVYGLILAIVGPIVIRLAYESVMLFILLVKNVIQINKKLKSSDSDSEYKFPSFKELTSKDNFAFIKKGSNPEAAPSESSEN